MSVAHHGCRAGADAETMRGDRLLGMPEAAALTKIVLGLALVAYLAVLAVRGLRAPKR